MRWSWLAPAAQKPGCWCIEFPQAGIYSPVGQRYEPVDADTIARYKESEHHQIPQEGICETGTMASFLAAGTASTQNKLYP